MGNKLVDDRCGEALLLDLDEQLEMRAGKKRQCRIEGERVFGMRRRVVRHHQRAGVRGPAHIELHTGYSGVAGGAREGGKRILLSAGGPATMRDEMHERGPRVAFGFSGSLRRGRPARR